MQQFKRAKPPFPALTVLADDSLAVHDGQPEHGDDWALANHSERTRTVIVEDQGWREDALTAARVTTLQAFRDLFSDQLLRPGDDVAINNVTFMFTDLAGSTALFERIGDAPAYRVVRDHFDVIGAMIREHDGSVVKTLGDGVHAAFSRPDDAVHCAMAIQGAFSPNGETPLPIRIGIHSGSSISVTLNDRLDYYGTTVNLAARLESLSDANETTLSEKIFSDPAVQETLSNASVRARAVSVRGVDAELTVHQFSVTDD
ncbi:MAG: adenylate/guanylate cyclase domain-containing protein [Pseudomonadota bacterium]